MVSSPTSTMFSFGGVEHDQGKGLLFGYRGAGVVGSCQGAYPLCALACLVVSESKEPISFRWAKGWDLETGAHPGSAGENPRVGLEHLQETIGNLYIWRRKLRVRVDVPLNSTIE